MKPTLEFTLANDIHSTKTNSASASIVINNGSHAIPTYPNPEEPISFPTITPIISQPHFPINFYIRLAEITTRILKSNNTTLLANLIDQSGKIILSAHDLVSIVGLLVNIPPEQITIQYCDEVDSTGCCGMEKYNPMKDIQSILINNVDFLMMYNREFNVLKTTFNISLSRCLVRI